MIAIVLRFWPYLLGLALIAGVLGGTYAMGRNHERSKWHVKVAQAQQTVARDALAAQKRADSLYVEIEALRARPARIRVETIREVAHVVPDADCRSMPASWVRVWDGAGDERTPAAAPGVDDAARVALADAAQAAAEARVTYAECAGRLEGLQHYVRDVVRPRADGGQ